jgi:ribosomal protein RSM22 (predicted rRNA methylase)
MYIFHTWTATVMDACDTDGTTEKKRANLRRNADMFEGAMKSMEVGRLKTDAKGVVMTLGKIFQKNFFFYDL